MCPLTYTIGYYGLGVTQYQQQFLDKAHKLGSPEEAKNTVILTSSVMTLLADLLHTIHNQQKSKLVKKLPTAATTLSLKGCAVRMKNNGVSGNKEAESVKMGTLLSSFIGVYLVF